MIVSLVFTTAFFKQWSTPKNVRIYKEEYFWFLIPLITCPSFDNWFSRFVQMPWVVISRYPIFRSLNSPSILEAGPCLSRLTVHYWGRDSIISELKHKTDFTSKLLQVIIRAILPPLVFIILHQYHRFKTSCSAF